jgi:hypothetical protein
MTKRRYYVIAINSDNMQYFCKAGTLPLEPHPQLFFAFVIFQTGYHAFCQVSASDGNSPSYTPQVARITEIYHHTQLIY